MDGVVPSINYCCARLVLGSSIEECHPLLPYSSAFQVSRPPAHRTDNYRAGSQFMHACIDQRVHLSIGRAD